MKKMKRFRTRIERKKNIEDALSIPAKKLFWKEFFEKDREWKEIRKNYNEEFFNIYNDAFDEFMWGDWTKAKFSFQRALEVRPKDQPSMRFIDIMKKYNFKKPDNWNYENL